MNRRNKSVPPPAVRSAVRKAAEAELGPLPKGIDPIDFLRHLGLRSSALEAKRKSVMKAIGYDSERSKHWTSDDFYFWLLRFEGNRVLHKKGIKERILKAIKENDLSFFIRLGRELKRKPIDLASLNNLEFLLAFGWESGVRKLIPPFHRFTDEALLEFFKHFGWGHLTLDSLRKTRQRLGLVQASKPLVRRIECVGEKLRFC